MVMTSMVAAQPAGVRATLPGRTLLDDLATPGIEPVVTVDPSFAPLQTAARERYEDALLRTGLPTGTPQEALDTACTVHLTEPGHEPEP